MAVPPGRPLATQLTRPAQLTRPGEPTRPGELTAGAATGTPLVAVRFADDALWALDQTRLPHQEDELELRSAEEVAEAIRRLAIRGAPLIGVAAAYGVALELGRDPAPDALNRACQVLRNARPTAVNLAYAVDRVRRAVLAAPSSVAATTALAEAQAIEREEQEASDAIATHGADYLQGAQTVLTHCNTGALAAPGRGTALAVIAELAVRGSLARVITTEARPLLQGARLTTYELARMRIPYELIVDAAAAGVIGSGAVDAVVVGCDRVAANGDVANKVGTYSLALAAQAASIPFVVAGPSSSIDLDCPSGAEIVIEERDCNEVRSAAGTLLTLPDAPCRNPAFDVTPARLLSALATERGVLSPVTADAIQRSCA